MTLNPKIAGFSAFFAISGCDTHFKIAPNWLETDLDNLRMIFLAQNVHFFKNLSSDLLNSRSLLYGGLKFE